MEAWTPIVTLSLEGYVAPSIREAFLAVQPAIAPAEPASSFRWGFDTSLLPADFDTDVNVTRETSCPAALKSGGGVAFNGVDTCLCFEDQDALDVRDASFSLTARVIVDPTIDAAHYSKIINKGQTSAGTPKNSGYALRLIPPTKNSAWGLHVRLVPLLAPPPPAAQHTHTHPTHYPLPVAVRRHRRQRRCQECTLPRAPQGPAL